MRPLFRLVFVLILASFMYRPLLRLQQTTRHFLPSTPAFPLNSILNSVSGARRSQSDMSRPNGTIATSGLELLTFGTPNGGS